MKAKKVIILNHNGGRLANQLWNFVGIYAYCLEKGYRCANYCFFEYSRYFLAPELNPNRTTKLLSFFYNSLKIIAGEKIARKISRGVHEIYVRTVKFFYSRLLIDSAANDGGTIGNGASDFYNLPPTGDSKNLLKSWENDERTEKIYFTGWRFRNPDGLKKFRPGIKRALEPKNNRAINDFIKNIRKPGVKLIGVHVRHGDYRIWNGGRYFFSFAEVRKILDAYQDYENRTTKKPLLFLICSDDRIDEAALAGLNYLPGPGTEINDLFALALTDLIIGSKSTYGPFAAYYGRIPFYTFSRTEINWAKSADIFLI
jgi:hypothetical protein